MARVSMASLLTRLRYMVEDTASPQLYSDDVLQDYLDNNRVRLAGALCGYDVLRLEFSSPYPNLEGVTGQSGSAELREPSGGDVLTPNSANYAAGTFTFTVAPDSVPEVWGYAYDLHAAAAEVWAMKAGRTNNWKGQYGLLAQQQIKFHKSLSWAHNGTASRVVEDLYYDRYTTDNN